MKKHSRIELGEIKNVQREFLKDKLGLTGCEVSMNSIPKGEGFPFIHSHKENEELYIILSGSGVVYLDGEESEITEGTSIRIAPSAKRGFKAHSFKDMQFICIQCKENSINNVTREDGIVNKVKASWLK